MKLIEVPSPLSSVRAFRMGECSIVVAREPINGRLRWHISTSHPKRLPSYEEIKHARYELIPNEVTMAQIFPPKEEFVNVHEYCLHLYEINLDED